MLINDRIKKTKSAIRMTANATTEAIIIKSKCPKLYLINFKSSAKIQRKLGRSAIPNARKQ